MDPLLRRIKATAPDSLVRAYADDIATVLPDMGTTLPLLLPVFQQFWAASGIRLNPAKMVAIPLGDRPAGDVAAWMRAHIPEWGAVLVQDWARYLGFALGPGRGSRSWVKAVEKARSRCKQWSQQPLGAQLAAFAYKVYVVSTLGFVAQLESLPVDVQRTEAGLLRTMVPGPRGWCSVDDLHRLRRDFGFPHEFPDIEKEAMAAKLRVVAWEAEASGGIRCRDRVARIVDALNRAPHLGRVMRLGTWALESYAHVLQENEEQLNNKGISVQQVNVLAAGGHRPWTEVQTRRAMMRFQRTAARAIRDAEPGRNVEYRLRLKLERWDVALFPRVRAIRASRVLQKLKTATPPRVLAAVLRTWFDGWCTMRRFGGIGSCVLCGRAEGTIWSIFHIAQRFAYYPSGVSALRTTTSSASAPRISCSLGRTQPMCSR